MKNKLAVIILAAGKGRRMKSAIPKVLHPVCGRPMLSYTLDLVKSLKAESVIAVLGHGHNEVRKYFPAGVKIAMQKELKGTADAVKRALALLKDFKGTVLVLYADNPLLKTASLKKLLDYHRQNNFAVTLLTARLEKPSGYGRILRDGFFGIRSIIEEKDADEFQKDNKEINTGIICFDKDKLAFALKRVLPNNRKKEYYLTDTVAILYKNNELIESVILEDADEALGVNSRLELAKVNSIMQQRINAEFMLSGVSLVDPDSIFISYGVKIGIDTVIYPFTVIEKDVKIGKHCSIGPFAHLREGTRLDHEVCAGNFLELSRSEIGAKTIIKHVAYIGDAKIGRSANIGAGTVTANFDGRKKNLTVIGDKAFIGSDTVLVAPVKIGSRAQTGAGAVVLKNRNVPIGATVAGVPAKPIKDKR